MTFRILILIFTFGLFLNIQISGQSLDTSRKVLPWWTLHFQQTFVEQYHAGFQVKYSGLNSFSDSEENALSLTTTLFAGCKLWKNAEIYFNPEVSGGSGLSKVQGIAGFPNNEVVRVGDVVPTFYPARLYFQQTINFGNKLESIEDEANQLPEQVCPTRLILRVGKISAMDFFDNNKYSHDGRDQFMDWALVSNGAWDYPADTRGYTLGFLIEYLNPEFAVRLMSGMVPTMPNGAIYDQDISKNHSLTAEIEKPYMFFGKSGRARFLLFYNQERSALYQDAIAKGDLNLTSSDNSDSVGLRRDGTAKYGACINLEQELNQRIGFFLRAGYNDGKSETWMYTEIDRSFSLGTVVNGNYWCRKNDEIGLAFDLNGLSNEHRNFLAHGGYGFLIGDGNLNYGIESIIETYYKMSITEFLKISLFYQFVKNPAYNKDRGPVNIFSLRTHIEF